MSHSQAQFVVSTQLTVMLNSYISYRIPRLSTIPVVMPTHSIQFIVRLIDATNQRIGSAVSWLTVAMVIVMAAIVALRYVFNLGWIAMQESVGYLHAIVFMLGAAYTLKCNGHVRVDIIYQRCSRKARAWIDFFGTLFLLVPVCGFIAWSSWDYTQASWAIHESSREAGGLPGVFLLKTIIPIMAGLMLLQGISLALRSFLILVEQPLSSDTPQE